MPITLAGSTGITTPGMESTAMPTVGGDAVVESGSNSDGEWTKWSDGTQECRFIDGTVGTNTGTTEKTWAYPAAFTAIPSISGCSVWSDTEGRVLNAKNPSATSTVYLLRILSGSADGAVSHLTATGRWK